MTFHFGERNQETKSKLHVRAREREMAKFSLGGGEDGEGPSYPPRPKRPRLFPMEIVREENEAEEEESDDEEEDGDTSDESEEQESSDDDDEEEELPQPQQPPQPVQQPVQQQPQQNNQIANVGPAPTPPPQPTRSIEVITLLGTAVVGPSRNGTLVVALTDPEVLDCAICCEPLTIPVFQCENGHTACSTCCRQLYNKCPSCSMPIGYNRCRAIEKVLESLKVSCSNVKYGCRETVSYSKKYEHEKSCSHAPCLCPLSGCHFQGSSKQLYQHCSSKHFRDTTHFKFNIGFPLFFTVNDKFRVLQEEKEGVVFTLNNRVDSLGNVITVSCIGPSASKEGYFYELAAEAEGSNVRFQSSTKNVPSKIEHPLSTGFLLVPKDFFGNYGQITLDVCIWRLGSSPAISCGLSGSIMYK